jgi:hypothetical protein
MGAREKLNEIHMLIAVAGAAVLGWATGSWIACGVSLTILIAVKLHSGAIRTGGRRKR